MLELLSSSGEDYVAVMQHPVTYEWKSSAANLQETLEAVTSLDVPAYWFWPNVDAGTDDISRVSRKHRENKTSSKIRFVKNLPPESFLALLNNAKCLIGNSSVGIRRVGNSRSSGCEYWR